MWKAVIFEDDDEEFLEDGSNPVSKKLKGGDGTGKSSTDTVKTLRHGRRKVLTKAAKKQITKYIRELNPTNISLLSLSEAKCGVPRHETDLLMFCENVAPSTTDFFVKHLQEMFEVLYDECSTIKDRYLQFQLKWHKHCSLFLVEKNLQLSLLDLHPEDPLAEKVVSIRAQWNKVRLSHSLTNKDMKTFLILFSSAVFNEFLHQCHKVLEGKHVTPVENSDTQDTYIRFGGAALATMLKLRYDRMKTCSLELKEQISQEITILKQICAHSKDHIPDYLKYRDNGHMYFPCPEILEFLKAVDTITKENVNEATFKEHGAELIQIATACVQSSAYLRSLFLSTLATKVPGLDDFSQSAINNVFTELVRKLSNTRIEEFIDSFKQNAAAHKGMASLAGQNLRDSLLSHHVNLKSKKSSHK